MFLYCECRVLSGRGLCDELITRPEESYRLWCVVVCDLETSRMRMPWPALGRSVTEKKYEKLLRSRFLVSVLRYVTLLGSETSHNFPSLNHWELGVQVFEFFTREAIFQEPVTYINWSEVFIRFGSTASPLAVYSLMTLNPLKTKRRLLYLKTYSVPRSKHFSSRL